MQIGNGPGSTINECSMIRSFHSSINSLSIEILKFLRVSTNSSISLGELTSLNRPSLHLSIICEQKLPSHVSAQECLEQAQLHVRDEHRSH